MSDQTLVDTNILLDVVTDDPVWAPRPALFLAAKAFHRYRASSGRKTGVLPDFLIGAHAAIAHLPLLTRDIARYRTYFPTVTLISPGT